MWNHFILRTSHHVPRFKDEPFSRWTWNWVKSNSSATLSLMLMPNHVHWIVAEPAQSDLPHRLRLALNREFGLNARDWDSIPNPDLITDQQKLLRFIRYVHLNPCRAGLVKDPLCWKWSTHRDWLGYAHHSLVSKGHAQTLRHMNREKFHHYVSADPSVDVSGTPLPSCSSQVALINFESLRIKIEQFFRQSIELLISHRNPEKALAVPLLMQSLNLKSSEVALLLELNQRQIQKYNLKQMNVTVLQRFREFVKVPRFRKLS